MCLSIAAAEHIRGQKAMSGQLYEMQVRTRPREAWPDVSRWKQLVWEGSTQWGEPTGPDGKSREPKHVSTVNQYISVVSPVFPLLLDLTSIQAVQSSGLTGLPTPPSHPLTHILASLSFPCSIISTHSLHPSPDIFLPPPGAIAEDRTQGWRPPPPVILQPLLKCYTQAV